MIFLAARVVSVWESQVPRLPQRETGGVLFGYETVSGDMVIADASAPGPHAKRGWLGFEPDQEWDTRLCTEVYASSGRIVRYLGEWHSHLFSCLRPSHDDIRTMRLIASYEPARVRKPVSAIVTRRPSRKLGWNVYQLDETGRMHAVAVKTFDDHLR